MGETRNEKKKKLEMKPIDYVLMVIETEFGKHEGSLYYSFSFYLRPKFSILRRFKEKHRCNGTPQRAPASSSLTGEQEKPTKETEEEIQPVVQGPRSP